MLVHCATPPENSIQLQRWRLCAITDSQDSNSSRLFPGVTERLLARLSLRLSYHLSGRAEHLTLHANVPQLVQLKLPCSEAQWPRASAPVLFSSSRCFRGLQAR